MCTYRRTPSATHASAPRRAPWYRDLVRDVRRAVPLDLHDSSDVRRPEDPGSDALGDLRDGHVVRRARPFDVTDAKDHLLRREGRRRARALPRCGRVLRRRWPVERTDVTDDSVPPTSHVHPGAPSGPRDSEGGVLSQDRVSGGPEFLPTPNRGGPGRLGTCLEEGLREFTYPRDRTVMTPSTGPLGPTRDLRVDPLPSVFPPRRHPEHQ